MANLGKISWILIGVVLVLSAFVTLLAFTDPENSMMYIILIVIISVLAVVLVLVLFSRDTKAELEYDGLTVNGPMLSLKIAYSEIISTELRNEFNPGIRIGGYGGIDRLGGNFRNKEFGTYKLGVRMSVKNYIVVRYKKDKILVFNLQDVGHTSEFYLALRKKVGK